MFGFERELDSNDVKLLDLGFASGKRYAFEFGGWKFGMLTFPSRFRSYRYTEMIRESGLE